MTFFLLSLFISTLEVIDISCVVCVLEPRLVSGEGLLQVATGREGFGRFWLRRIPLILGAVGSP